MSHQLIAGGDAVFGYVKIVDGDGVPVTNATHATAGLAMFFYRDGADEAEAIALAEAVLGTWESGGFVHVGGGLYQIGLPASAVTALTGDSSLVLLFGTYTGGQVIPMAISPLAAPVDGSASQTTANAIKQKADLLGTGQAQLTQGDVTAGGTIILRVATTCEGTLAGVGDLSAASKVWLTIKFRDTDPDDAALVQIEKTGGLLRIAGQAVASPVAGNDGSINVATADQITFRLEARAAALLMRYRESAKLVYDVKVDDGTDIRSVVEVVAELRYPVTRAVA